MSDPDKIVRLIRTQGTTRVFEMEDGSTETREGGTVSWRNNNPGNLKFEYARSADSTVRSTRSKADALTAAQSRYDGVVALDQWGNAIFETETAGRAAKAQLLQRAHGDKTIPEMLSSYARDDYTGKANTQAYTNSVYAEGDRQGVNLRSKKIKDLNSVEFEALLDGMKRVEGFKEGEVTRTQATTSLDVEGFTPNQARTYQAALDALGPRLQGTLTADQIEALARSAAMTAEDNAQLGDVNAVLLNANRDTIALKQEFGITEIGLANALARGNEQEMAQGQSQALANQNQYLGGGELAQQHDTWERSFG